MLVAYFKVTVYNSQRNDRGSPIPRTQLTITWPSTITLSGSRQPLLVPTNLVRKNKFCAYFKHVYYR